VRRFVLAGVTALALIVSGQARAVVLQGQNADVSQYQRWADASAIPTYPGLVRLTLGGASGECGGDPQVIGCTNVAWDGVPQVWITPTYALQDRQVLYHELGQVFDFMDGNAAMFSTFEAIWQVAEPPGGWWTPDPSLRDGPLGEWFAEGYRECADNVQGRMTATTEGARLTYGTIFGYPGGVLTTSARRRRWALRKQHMVCDLIRESSGA
jgi:hypothetical protein